MIAKCIAVLAIIGQINAAICGCGPSSVVLPNTGRTVVAQGKYPVALSNCGPGVDQQIPVTTTSVTVPCQEKPTIRLPAKIPAPRTICHTCTCYKTIVRPRVQQQIITVPTVQRYIETLQKPVVESVQYEALPVNCGGVAGSSCGMISVGAGSVCGSTCGSVCGSPVQTVQLSSGCSPCATPVEIAAPCAQSIQVPSCGVSCAQPIQVPTCDFSCAQPTLQVVSSPCAQQIQVPSCDVSCAQPIQVPSCEVSCAQPTFQVVSSPCAQTIQVPTCQSPVVESIPAPCVQRFEIPQTISLGCSSPCRC